MPERCRVGSLGCLKSALTVLIVPSWLDIGLSHQPVWHRADLCLSLALSLLLPHTHPHTWRMRARIEAIAKNPTLSATPPSGVRTTPPREREGERESPPSSHVAPLRRNLVCAPPLEFGVWGLGFGVWGLGLGIWGFGHFRRKAWICSGSKSSSYLRLIDSCITQLKDHGPPRTCNEGEGKETSEFKQQREGVRFKRNPAVLRASHQRPPRPPPVFAPPPVRMPGAPRRTLP